MAVSTGPKISSRAIRIDGVASVKIVGAMKKPPRRAAGRTRSRWSRPRPRRPASSVVIRSSWALGVDRADVGVLVHRIADPQRLHPGRSAGRRTPRRSTPGPAVGSPAQQTWPWLKKMPLTMPSIAWSWAASSNTMLAPLPPSSRVILRPVPARLALDPPADGGGAGEGHLVQARVVDQRRADVPGPGDDVDHPGRQVGVGDDLGQHQDRQRRGLGGLDHHGVPGRQRGRDLPGRHQQREVPRDHLTRPRRAGAGSAPSPRCCSLSAQPAW